MQACRLVKCFVIPPDPKEVPQKVQVFDSFCCHRRTGATRHDMDMRTRVILTFWLLVFLYSHYGRGSDSLDNQGTTIE